jgi:hypothetical protein
VTDKLDEMLSAADEAAKNDTDATVTDLNRRRKRA